MNTLHIFSFLSLPSIVFAVVQSLSHVQFFAITWTVAHQVPLSMGFPRQEYWSGLPFPSPEDLLDPGMELMFLALADRFFTTKPPGKPSSVVVLCCAQLLSRVQLFATPWTDSLLCSWGVSRQEYWSGLPCLPPGDLPNPGIEPRSPALQADSLLPELPGKPKNTGVGRLSLLRVIIPTQELN